MKAGRCTGHCCSAFPLPFSPTEICEMVLNNGSLPAPDGGMLLMQDGEQISRMVIPLGYQTDNGKHVYTCRNLDELGNCRIYDERPRMCSDYPYGNECEIEGCTAPARGLALPPEQLVAIRRRWST